uniref:Rad51-like C-terminal domain-containing protein n=1 Tax=Kwoniella bestiolae CBS 10118 TaxID=1296100 RepID=A0A1B9GAB5_9TREE|nr:hypothetical protein I302_02815 [Kwoniella bestiolae CBS 10118]OCF27965.1 hypothetical protein I302_02815 [Kwoniella bestiolae CBS 10118]
MLLKRLVDSLPAELATLVPELDSAGIKTTESLIFSSPSTVLRLVPILSTIQLDCLVSICVRLTAPEGISADEVEEVDGGWKGFGIDILDDMFGKWDGIGVIELAGPRKVGKSLLALHASLRILASDPEAICTWIDTEGSFSPERANMILEEWHVDEPNLILERIVVINAFKLEDMFEAISQIRNDLLSATSAQGHADLITLMEEIAEITYSKGMVSFIINSTASSHPTNPQSSFNKMDIKPALGVSFTFTTDITLLIQETGRIFGLTDAEEKERIRNKPGLRGLVEVIRSRICHTGNWTVFETDGVKLFDIVPPHEIDEKTTRISAGLPTGPYRPKIGSLAQTLIP